MARSEEGAGDKNEISVPGASCRLTAALVYSRVRGRGGVGGVGAEVCTIWDGKGKRCLVGDRVRVQFQRRRWGARLESSRIHVVSSLFPVEATCQEGFSESERRSPRPSCAELRGRAQSVLSLSLSQSHSQRRARSFVSFNVRSSVGWGLRGVCVSVCV